jgi:hypothetical protein
MRYIKVFEEFGNDEFFRRIEWSEWKEKAYEDNPEYEKISNIEKTWIIDKLKPFQPELKWDVPWTRGEIKSKISFTSNEGKNIIIFLSKLSDDWFILECVFDAKPEFGHALRHLYICDQFDGLKHFFKEILGL